ncbi:MAG TPA: hypothetical protein VG815_07390, partial [Chloroflexota bacterium]|nr:hypothetical protein [Chloroflexota bacterium]
MARELPSPAPGAEDILAEVSGGEGVFVTDHLVLDLETRLGGKLWLRILRLAPPLGVFALVLILWQFGVPAVGIRDFQLPVPTEIWQTFRSDEGSLLNDGWFT